jgi:hypothetical protein
MTILVYVGRPTSIIIFYYMYCVNSSSYHVCTRQEISSRRVQLYAPDNLVNRRNQCNILHNNWSIGQKHPTKVQSTRHTRNYRNKETLTLLVSLNSFRPKHPNAVQTIQTLCPNLPHHRAWFGQLGSPYKITSTTWPDQSRVAAVGMEVTKIDQSTIAC